VHGKLPAMQVQTTACSADLCRPSRGGCCNWLCCHHGTRVACLARFLACFCCCVLPCRPAVVIAYLVAGFSALLSSLCYAEFSANMSLSGGAFS
jgi:hypothetical protein